MNTAEVYTLLSEIADLAALSNLSLTDKPVDKLMQIFFRAVQAMALIDVEYDALFADMMTAHEERLHAPVQSAS
jgi:hypothetical protein